jgi:predicted signal transduction protein with EAL and GGDEF domain
MTVRATQRTPCELRSLEARKRGVYTVAALAGVVVTMLSWFTRDPDDIVIEVIYPGVAVALLVFVLALHRNWASLQTLERLILGVLTVVIMGRLAWHLLWGGHIDEHLLVLTGGHYWAVAVLLIAGFVLLGRRSGLWFGVGVLLTSVLLVASGAGRELVGPDASDQALLYLVRLHGFLVMVLVLVLAVATLRDQLHRALTQAETFEQLAAVDPLTGLANRRTAIDVLKRELQQAERYGTTVSVVALDIDHFKAVNDAHGHQVGDAVLRDIGDLLSMHTPARSIT